VHRAIVSGPFDQVLLKEMRFLELAAASGPLRVELWSDRTVEHLLGHPPKCPEAERLYVLNALRFVAEVKVVEHGNIDAVRPQIMPEAGATWVVDQASNRPENARWCDKQRMAYRVVSDVESKAVPSPVQHSPASARRPKVLVTGCYDWFHSGHVRFFEEVSRLGELYVVVGHDDNIRLLKGEGHPMFPADQRRYIVGAVKYVYEASVSTGHGWLDAEPEIERIRPDIYAVNEDGDRPEKRQYCQSHGIEYRVLMRQPKNGLPRRESTDLRGF